MSVDWKRFFSEPQTLGIIITSGVVGLIVGLAQGIIQRRHGGWRQFLGAVATAAVVAVISGLAIQGVVSSEPLRFAIVGVCAVVSEDIWIGLKTLGLGMRADPLGFIARVLDALRGRSASSRPVTGDEGDRQ